MFHRTLTLTLLAAAALHAQAPQGYYRQPALRGDTLVFVEVKTRRSETYGAPAEAVTTSKQHLIARGALAWLRLLGNPDIPFRFDIVEVRITGKNVEANLIRDAFGLPKPYRY